MVKRIISMIFSAVMLFGLCPEYYAAEAVSAEENRTAVYQLDNVTINKGQNRTFDLGKTYSTDITAEFDYDLSNTSWSGDCNIPMILLDSNGTEIGRISVYSKDSEILSTRMENGSGGTIINTGGIERSGTLIIEADFENKRLIFKSKGAEYKRSAVLGYISFSGENIGGAAKIKAGAGGNPGITLNIRVYEGISETMKAEYGFKSDYTGSLSSYNDFNGSDSTVVLADSPQKQNDKSVFVSDGKVWRMDFMPRDCGFTGKIGINYSVYVSSDGNIFYAPLGGLKQYITGATTEIIGITAADSNTIEVSADGKKYRAVTEESIANRWIKIECFLDLDNKKANIRADGKIITAEDGSAAVPVSDFKIFNQIYARAAADMYIDDICIIGGREEINVFSDVFKADNENRRISGADMSFTPDGLFSCINAPNCTMKLIGEDDAERINGMKSTDVLAVTGKSGYTAYYSIDFMNYNIGFEGEVQDRFTGGKICNAPYGRSGNAIKSNSDTADCTVTVYFPTDKEYDTVEFDICFENNTAQGNITINNANNRQFSKLYLFNQETIAFLAGSNSYNHAVTTKDRTWKRFKAVLDRENGRIVWYMDGRALQNEPFEFANLYDGENTLFSISVFVSGGAYAYIDNVSVSNSSEENIIAESDIYSVDNEYKMITGVECKTTAADFLSAISPGGCIAAKDGRIRTKDEYIKTGDSVRFYENNTVTEYAIGVEKAERKTLTSNNAVKLYVSANGNDGGDGSEASPYKTLEHAFEKAALTDGSVNIEIIGESYGGGNYIKNIKKNDGTVTLTSNVPIVGGIGIERSKFRGLNDEEKELFSAAPDKILCADTDMNIGKTRQSGWNLPFLPSSAQLLVNGETKTAARYPNEGYIKSGEIISSSSTGVTFKYTDNRADGWKNLENARIWSHFGVTYGGHDVPVSGINVTDKTVSASGAMYSTGIKNPIEYYIYNLPEELDSPGEYYIDEAGGHLYYYPESEEDFRAVLTDGSSALLRFENCSDIIIDGLSLEGGRGNGIEISDCENVTVRRCEVSGQGMNGVVITDGSDCGIENSEIHHTDGDAVKLYGGDMYTLSESGHYVTECDIHDFSLRKKSYTSAVTTSGCGMEISGNRIYNAPHTGLFLRSCETDISKNRFEKLTYDAEDMGAIYSVDTYIRRGVRVHDNYFEGIRNRYKSGIGLVKCIYMDNFTSGWEIKNNVFYDCDQGIHANGGRENTVEDNLFISADLPLGMYNLSQSAYITAPLYQSMLGPLGSRVWKNHYKGIDEFAVLYPKQPYGTSVGGNVIAGAKKNNLQFDGFMNISDSATLSADSISDGLICDYGFCEKNVKHIADNVAADRITADGLIPFCGEMHIKKGETKEIAVMLGGKIYPVDSIEASNETRLRIEASKITAVNCGTVKLTVKCGDFSKTITVVCE